MLMSGVRDCLFAQVVAGKANEAKKEDTKKLLAKYGAK